MLSRLRLTALALPFLFFAACGGEVSEPAEPTLTTRVDTVGDTVVVRIAGDVPPAEEWRVEESWRVGDADDPTVGFGRVGQSAIGADGTVYAVDPTGPELRAYDATGTALRVIGGRGGGPGEYTRANGVAVLADGRVALWDAGGARVNLYDPDGTYLGLARVPVSSFYTSNNGLIAHPGGGFWVRGFVRDTANEALVIGRNAWFRYVNDSLRDTLLSPPPGEDPPRLLAQNEGSVAVDEVPYYSTPGAEFTSRGAVWTYGGDGYVLRRVGGGPPVRIERTVSSIPIPEEERTERRALVTWNLQRTEPDWRWNGPEIPTEKAPVADLVPAADGRLLVRVATPSEHYEPDPPATIGDGPPRPRVHWRSREAYEVYGADGMFAGRFTLPAGGRLLALRDDRVLYRIEDDLGVPYLVMARLREPSAAAAAG